MFDQLKQWELRIVRGTGPETAHFGWYWTAAGAYRARESWARLGGISPFAFKVVRRGF